MYFYFWVNKHASATFKRPTSMYSAQSMSYTQQTTQCFLCQTGSNQVSWQEVNNPTTKLLVLHTEPGSALALITTPPLNFPL